MPRFLALAERNDVPFSDLSGTLNPGGSFLVQGLARAGRSATGVGSWFQGTYGALLINPDGSYTYRLDNADPDTNLLAAGQVADDRFTYTYAQNGIVHTDTIIVHVSGVDEAGQQVTGGNNTILFTADGAIEALQQFRITATAGLIVSAETNPVHVFVNRGMIHGEAPTSNGATAIAVEQHGRPESLELINEGLIEAHAGAGAHQAIGAGASGGANITNHGVIRAVAEGVNQSGYSQATGAGGWHLINTGLIEAISTFEAWAVSVGKTFDNFGLVYAEGAARFNVPGIAGVYEGASAGMTINNSGTIWAVSRTAGVDSFGIAMFRDSTNHYAYATVNNSGTIVADIAVHAWGTSVGGITGMHVYNSGHVEGDFDMDLGMNMLVNQAGGTWIGDVRGGYNEDVVRNRGLIEGAVTLGLEDDLYDGLGGVQIGSVDGGGGFDVLLGGAAGEQLSGGAGRDRLQGNGGADTLAGGADADLFVYVAASDSTTAAPDLITDFQTGLDRIDLGALSPSSVGLSAGGGITTVTAQTAGGVVTIRVSGAISQSDIITTPKAATVNGTDNAEILYAIVPGSQIFGFGGDDVLDGSDGADVLDGGAGMDLMRGGAGNDIYYGDVYGDRVIEFDGEGIDELRTFDSARLHGYVENLTMLGQGDIFATGNPLANVITCNSGWNEVYAEGGDDVLIGGGGGDSLRGGEGRDRYVYLAATDSMNGARDHLYFVGGEDLIDLRAVNPIAVSWQETMGGYWQAFSISNIVTVQTAAGTMSITVDGRLFMSDFLLGGEIVGTAGADMLTGTAGGDVVLGGDGNDVLNGMDAADTLSGQAGDDILDGGAGADRMTGGFGDDLYRVDNAGDLAWEEWGAGYDTVAASVSYTLAARSSVEILQTVDRNGTAAINLTGNTADNIIKGNAGDNILDGGVNVEDPNTYIPAGVDTLIGYGGNDTYLVDGGGDVIIEAAGGGYDSVFARASFVLNADAEIELIAVADQPSIYAGPVNLTGNAFAQTLRGNGDANILDGGGGADFLSGGAGNDRLIGGAGNDRLEGGAGADTFVFAAQGDSSISALRSDGAKFMPDLILDFASGQDKIDLAAIDAVAGTAGNDAFTFLGTAAFTGHAGELRYQVSGGYAHIFADLDGNGLADMEILANPTTLVAADFVL
jgi:VCBS repeat-containing protein